MHAVSDFAEFLPGLISAQPGAMVILAAFGLAAFAIYAVVQVAKERRK